MPKSCSRGARNSTKVSESTRPVSIKSVSTDGTWTFNFSENSAVIRRSTLLECGMSRVLVLGGEKVEQQPVQQTAVDTMTLSLQPDVLEVQPLQHPLRRDVRLDGPRGYDPY